MSKARTDIPEDQPECRLPKKRLCASVEQQQRLLLRASVYDKLLDVVPPERFDTLVAEHGGTLRTRLFPSAVTLGLFVEQVINVDDACQDAVGRYLSQRLAMGLTPCGLSTGAYCKARQRLPLPLLEACVREVADIASAALPAAACWRGREVKLIDGTTVSMPDTPALQTRFPQSGAQQPGLGFPVARIVGVISLGSGCVSDWTVCACRGEGTGEAQQLWRLLDTFQPGEVLLADRAYSSYFLLAALQQRGIDFVIREHACRKNDPARNHVLGPNESTITWDRPKQPEWMDDADYAALPQTLSVREVRDGNRRLVTSLRDIQQASAEEIGWLYTQRWQIELDFRAIKCVMQMDILRCKTPDMVCKEIAAHWLGYNLIRAVMGEAAKPEGLPLRRLSFAAARRASAQFQENLRQLASEARRTQARFVLLQSIAHWRVPDRPGRIEPRAIKRRPKPRALLTVPRHEARARIRAEQQRMWA